MLIKFSSQTTNIKFSPVKVFYSYSHKDERFIKNLIEHLAPLKRQGFIDEWYDRKILPGDEWKGKIDKNLESSDIILLMISSSFIASGYCYDVEMKKALEKHDSGEAIVIPIILRPTFWQILPFAKLQALPKDGKPIALYKIKDEAYVEISEKLRSKIVELKDATLTNEAKEVHKWHWILKLTDSAQINDKKADNIIINLRKISGDATLTIVAFGDNKNTIIIEGNENSFRKVEKLFSDKQLLEIDNIPIISLYLAYGAGIKFSSTIINKAEANQFENLLYRSRKHIPMLFKGIHVSNKKPLGFDFILDTGDEKDNKRNKEDSERLLSYFITCLAVDEDDLWVNLSAYESNRMIPEILGGTQLGRDLLAQDCLLKQFTASLIHPDTEIGRLYWKEVYQKAYSLFGTTKLPIRTFQKVWLKPSKAVVFETDLPTHVNETDSDILKSMADKDGKFAYVVEDKLLAICEEDFFALKHNIPNEELNVDGKVPKRYHNFNDFTIPIFREIVLPAIQEEVDSCLNFKLIRQIYFSLILATWYQKNCANHLGYQKLVHTYNPNAFKPTVSSISDFVFSNTNNIGDRTKINEIMSNRKEPLSIASYTSFDIKENKEYYGKYIELFEKGIFNIIRKEFDSFSDTIITRSYFSGKISLEKIDPRKRHNYQLVTRGQSILNFLETELL